MLRFLCQQLDLNKRHPFSSTRKTQDVTNGSTFEEKVSSPLWMSTLDTTWCLLFIRRGCLECTLPEHVYLFLLKDNGCSTISSTLTQAWGSQPLWFGRHQYGKVLSQYCVFKNFCNIKGMNTNKRPSTLALLHRRTTYMSYVYMPMCWPVYIYMGLFFKDCFHILFASLKSYIIQSSKSWSGQRSCQ